MTPNYLSLTDGPIITLEQMLQARDLRVARQQQWLTQYKKPLISITMVIPGEIKNSSGTTFLFETALKAVTDHFQAKQLTIVAQQSFIADCGLEALFSIDADAELIKQQCIEIETQHPLGRFWDLDVICPEHGGLSRRNQNTAVRQCLLCDNEAHACARSRQHPLTELINVMEEQINAFRSQQSIS